MSRILRALLISAVATGAAAMVLKLLQPEPPAPSRPRPASNPYVDAGQMTEEQMELLMQELESQV